MPLKKILSALGALVYLLNAGSICAQLSYPSAAQRMPPWLDEGLKVFDGFFGATVSIVAPIASLIFLAIYWRNRRRLDLYFTIGFASIGLGTLYMRSVSCVCFYDNIAGGERQPWTSCWSYLKLCSQRDRGIPEGVWRYIPEALQTF